MVPFLRAGHILWNFNNIRGWQWSSKCSSCMTQREVQQLCHPITKYSILYGALIIFVVGSGQE